MTLQPVVAEIMTHDPAVLKPGDWMATAGHEMELCSIRHLPVVDDEGKLVGVVSQRDVAGCKDTERRVRDAMSQNLLTVAPETPAHEAAYLLLRHKIGCLPVVSDEGFLMGIVTETDFVRVAFALLGGLVDVDQLELEEREAERV